LLQALGEEAPPRLQALMEAGLRQHRAMSRLLQDVAAACNEMAIAAAAASGTANNPCFSDPSAQWPPLVVFCAFRMSTRR
jgi:hypothetical protein